MISDDEAFIHLRFQIKELGELSYFLGIKADGSKRGIFINHRKYTLVLLNEAGLLACKPFNTPMDTT